MENDTQVTTPTPDPHAPAAGEGQLLNNGLEAPSPGATTVAETPPATRQRPRTRRERGKPVYRPTAVRHADNPKEEPIQPVSVAEDEVRLDYEFVLRGGREEVVRVKSQLILPMALALENLPQTESSFPEMVDRVLVQPLNTKFRAFLQRLFDAASRAAIEKQTAAETPLPPHSNGGYKSPKPGNSTPLVMPELDAKPPLPQRPGSRDWAAGKNGV
jgi:hypothetical protein